MHTIGFVLAIAAGWFILACVLWLVVYMPLFRSARRTDALVELAAGEQLEAPRRVEGSGYAGLVLDRTVDLARSLLGVERSWILLRDPDGRDGNILAAARGLDDDLIGTRFAPGATPGGEARGTTSAPIALDGTVRGTFSVAAGNGNGKPSAAQLELLGELAQLCGAALAHHGPRREAEHLADVQLSALQRALDAWDDDTAGHSEHVVELAVEVGERLGLTRAELIELELGARLHDVGKLRVPAGVLRKPGPLTDSERRLVQRHAAWGGEIVAGIPTLQAVASIVRHHHERFDGGGYPSGIAGGRTPLASRILGACDAYSAMTRDRPYRRARRPAEAIAELRAHAGTQFDPAVVGALTDAFGRPPARPARRRPSRQRSLALVGALVGALLLPAAQAAADCPAADARPGEASTAELEAASICLINELRRDRGVRPLRQSRKLSVAGARHAGDMVDRRYFGHDSLDGTPFTTRVLRTGYVPSDARWILGENLAWGSGDMSTPRSRVEAWSHSPTHRRIMLEERFLEVGVGVVRGVPYATRFSAAATYAAEFGAVWGGRSIRIVAPSSSWSSSRSSSKRSRSFRRASAG